MLLKLLADILATDKGKKLIARVMGMMPSQAPAMLPTTLRVVFTAQPVKKEIVEKMPASAERFAMESAAEAEEVIVAAAMTAVEAAGSSAKAMSYKEAKQCITTVMMPHTKVRARGVMLRLVCLFVFVLWFFLRGWFVAGPTGDDDQHLIHESPM